jgi:hypothetical protein
MLGTLSYPLTAIAFNRRQNPTCLLKPMVPITKTIPIHLMIPSRCSIANGSSIHWLPFSKSRPRTTSGPMMRSFSRNIIGLKPFKLLLMLLELCDWYECSIFLSDYFSSIVTTFVSSSAKLSSYSLLHYVLNKQFQTLTSSRVPTLQMGKLKNQLGHSQGGRTVDQKL